MGTHEINGRVKETHGIKCEWGVKGAHIGSNGGRVKETWDGMGIDGHT